MKSYNFEFINDAKLGFSVSIKQRSKESGFCGDSYLNFSIKNKKYYLISDGMGHGKKASEDSKMALFILKSFIELGMNVENSINLCNVLMYEKNNDKFNTLDLLECDNFVNEINLYKNGSGATYLKSEDSIKKINSENLPLGIVEKINVEKIKINPNCDYIILTSDGIKNDLSEILKNTKVTNAKSLTNEIIGTQKDSLEDDQTIVVLNVIKK